MGGAGRWGEECGGKKTRRQEILTKKEKQGKAKKKKGIIVSPHSCQQFKTSNVDNNGNKTKRKKKKSETILTHPVPFWKRGRSHTTAHMAPLLEQASHFECSRKDVCAPKLIQHVCLFWKRRWFSYVCARRLANQCNIPFSLTACSSHF